jgi:hypothetical protein
MTKNEIELTIGRAQVTTDYVGAPPGAKRTWYRFCALVAALATLCSASAWSQTQLAAVSGIITDPSGAVVPGAGVTVVSRGTGLKRSALTDTAGEYRFAGLPTGSYSLRIEKTGFQSQVREGIELNSAAEVTINSQLAIGDLSQQTTVIANVAGIDNTTSSVSELLPEQSLAELPLDNRDLFSAVALEPGVAPNPSSGPSLLSSGKSGQVAINGIRPNMTNVLIDGMDATDPVFIPERPNLIGNPNAGVCPNGAAVGTVSCWFNPSAFAVPPAGQFGNAGRNILRGPAFAQFDASLHKDFVIAERRKITVGVEAYNLFNHPNFGVPSNTQSPLTFGGNGDAVFKDATGNFADNAGQILTTVGTARQIQLAGRFTF